MKIIYASILLVESDHAFHTLAGVYMKDHGLCFS